MSFHTSLPDTSIYEAVGNAPRTLLAELHAQHKARQARMGFPQIRQAPPSLTADQTWGLAFALELLARHWAQRARESAAAASAMRRLAFHPEKRIAAGVANRWNIPVADILSRKRDKRTAAARYEVMWRLRHQGKYSYPRIGRMMDRDHTSVLHGVRVHEARLARETRRGA